MPRLESRPASTDLGPADMDPALVDAVICIRASEVFSCARVNEFLRLNAVFPASGAAYGALRGVKCSVSTPGSGHGVAIKLPVDMGGKETYICLLDKGLVATLQVEPEALKRFEGFLCVQLRGTEYLNAQQYSHLLNWLEDVLGEVSRQSDMRVWCITAVAKDYRWCQTLACYPDGRSECKMVQASCLLGK